MTKWRDVFIRETPRAIVHDNLLMSFFSQKLSMNFNTTNGQDAKEQYEIERRKNNVVIRGMHEDDSENALSLIENITKFFEDRFAMRDVIVYAAHRYMLCDMFSFCYASCYRICRT